MTDLVPGIYSIQASEVYWNAGQATDTYCLYENYEELNVSGAISGKYSGELHCPSI